MHCLLRARCAHTICGAKYRTTDIIRNQPRGSTRVSAVKSARRIFHQRTVAGTLISAGTCIFCIAPLRYSFRAKLIERVVTRSSWLKIERLWPYTHGLCAPTNLIRAKMLIVLFPYISAYNNTHNPRGSEINQLKFPLEIRRTHLFENVLVGGRRRAGNR